MGREVEFMIQFWDKMKRYLERYSVDGYRLVVKEPGSIEFMGKIPDIVVVDSKGIPRLVIEVKRKVEGRALEELLNPLGPIPIAQAICYAALAAREYGLEKTPLFATANRDAIILFKGINRTVLDKIVDVDVCLESKRSYRDWVKALKPSGLEILFKDYIVDRIEHPLSDYSLKKLLEYVGKWITRSPISPTVFYRVFVDQLRGLIESLHEIVRDAVKSRILSDREYFIKLFIKAREAGYPYGLFSRGLLELKCSSKSRIICEYIKEYIEEELCRIDELSPEKAFEIMSNISRRLVDSFCLEARRLRGLDTSSIPVCGRGLRVGDILSFDNLTKMMVYVLANKILAYKILELHYGEHIPLLKPIHYGSTVEISGRVFIIRSPSDLKEFLDYLFNYASARLEQILGIKDFSPIFKTGLYDEIIFSGIDSINRVSVIIDLIDGLKHELKYLPGVIGYVYEGLLPPRERHQLGQFYTPPTIARLITKWAIRSGRDRVLDAGCGSGTFLIEAYKRLLKQKFNKDYDAGAYPSCTKEYNEHQEVLNQLYGVDINAFASLFTSIHLMLMEPRCPISSLNVETRDFFTLVAGSKAFNETVRGFDVVIGNPPYTRWVEIPVETRDLILKMLDSEIKRYDLRADLRRGREPGIYVYWIMHACKNLLKHGGRLGLIVSNMWLQTDYGVDFGKFLLDNFRVTALIDLSFRLFKALVSTVIILAEKEASIEARNSNIVTLVRIPPRIKGEELGVGSGSRVLESVLECVENAIRSDGSMDVEYLARCREEYGIQFTQVRQGDIPRDKKWISLFFKDIGGVLEILENHPLIVKLGEWFEPSYGNALYLCLSSWSAVRGVRNLGAKDFFYFSREKIDRWSRMLGGFSESINQYLVPAITRSQYIRTFTFTRGDWRRIVESGKDAYMFVCSKPLDKLPQVIQEYIGWGETECRTRIRRSRGGGRVCSEAEACKARARQPTIFKGWYDLGGYIPTPVMAIRQAFYHQQFFYAEFPLVTYDAIIAFIPKVRVSIREWIYDPSMYSRYLTVREDIELDEIDVKALLAYLNSTFIWLWVEKTGRRTGGGIISLEVQQTRELPLLNVKMIGRNRIVRLAQLFDKLELKARQLIGSSVSKLEMFKNLKQELQEIDREIAGILDIDIDVNKLWSTAWEMMERRVKGARVLVRPGVKVSIEVGDKRSRSRSKRNKSSTIANIAPIDKWFKIPSS